MKNPSFQTRREFLRTTLLGGALTWTIPSFLQATIQSLQAASRDSFSTVTGKDGPLLVVLQLAGGNDGLNTLIPFNNDYYYKARSKLAIAKKDIIKFNDDLGFHSSLESLKALYDQGHLAILQGVGYPNPNRSHFRSTEIWQTAVDSNQFSQQGWLGRYFDNQCQGMDATVGVSIGQTAPQAFAAKKPTGVTFQNPQQYREVGSEKTTHGIMQNNSETMTGSSIGDLSGNRPMTGESPIDFLERTEMNAQVSSDRILSIVQKARTKGSYPNSKLARDLELVSKLIAGGMSTRVYYVSHGGFDTHSNQGGTHERLLKELGEALSAFVKDLEAQGNLKRTVIMTFSEFGRRVEENASGGTDHGTAAPMFITGGLVKGGVFGAMPSLAPKDLDEGDLRHTVDFRSAYATILEKHLHAPGQAILGRTFPQIGII